MLNKKLIGLTTVIVDDEIPILEILGLMVKLKFNYVYLHDNVDDALETLKTVTPDLAMIDGNIGTRSGEELIKHMHDFYRFDKTTVVSMSASYAFNRMMSMEYGAIAMEKPFDMTELDPLIAKFGRGR